MVLINVNGTKTLCFKWHKWTDDVVLTPWTHADITQEQLKFISDQYNVGFDWEFLNLGLLWGWGAWVPSTFTDNNDWTFTHWNGAGTNVTFAPVFGTANDIVADWYIMPLNWQFVVVPTTWWDATITLPNASSARDRSMFKIKKWTNDANKVIVTSLGWTIDWNATEELTLNGWRMESNTYMAVWWNRYIV